MKNLTVLAAAGLLLMVSSCGSSLTGEQKQIFFSTLENANSTSSSLASVSSKSTGEELPSNVRINETSNSNLSKRLEDKFDTSECAVKSELTEKSFSVSGSKCPISFNVSGDVNMINSQSATANIKMAFAILDKELSELEDVRVTEMDFSVNLSVSGSQNSGKITGGFGGHLLTKDYGKVVIGGNIDVSADQNGASGEVLMTYQFPEFTAKLEVDLDNGKITLNGEELNQEDLAKLGSMSPSKVGL